MYKTAHAELNYTGLLTHNRNLISPRWGVYFSLQWCHNGRDGVPIHQPRDCLLNRLFRRGSKKTSKLRVTGLVRGIHRWIPRTKGQLHGKCFHLMTSLCVRRQVAVGKSTQGNSYASHQRFLLTRYSHCNDVTLASYHDVIMSPFQLSDVLIPPLLCTDSWSGKAHAPRSAAPRPTTSRGKSRAEMESGMVTMETAPLVSALGPFYEDFGAKSRHLMYVYVIPSLRILWGVITYPRHA